MGRRNQNPEGGRTLTDVLKEAIRTSGLTLKDLAEEVGVSAAQLSRFVRDERSLSLPVVERLMTYFQMTVHFPGEKKAKTN
jgi:plasmid maintenance system antidote protein VapI